MAACLLSRKYTSILFTLWLVFLLSISGCQNKESGDIPDELKKIGGNILFVGGKGDTRIQKYNLATGQCSIFIDVPFILTAPQIIYEERSVLCWSENGIYKLAGDKLLKIFDSKLSNYCYLGNNRIAYIPKGTDNYTIRMTDLKTGISKDIIELPNKYSDLTSFRNILMFSRNDGLNNNSIYRLQIFDDNSKGAQFIAKGECPRISLDGKKLAYIDLKDSEIVIRDLRTNITERTGVKWVAELAWLQGDWVIYERWRSKPFFDWLELGVADYKTGKTYALVRGNAGYFGSGLAWMDF